MSEETAVSETAPAENTEAAPEATEEVLPEWAREKLTKANNEAAKYRTRAKEAAQQAAYEAEEKFTAQLKELSDEKAALAAELHEARTSAQKFQAAISVGIPGESAAEFADLLKGENEEEFVAHANKLKEMFGTPEKSTTRFVDKSQGFSSEPPANTDAGFGAFVLSQLTK